MDEGRRKFRLVPGEPVGSGGFDGRGQGEDEDQAGPRDRKESYIFVGQDLQYCTAERIVALVGAKWATQVSMNRALKFQPQEGDVVVSAAPNSGEGIVLCMLQLLALGENSVNAQGNRTDDGAYYPIPLIESKDFDKNPRGLDDLQPGVLRLYKTHMDALSMRDKIHGEGKVICVLRDPKDYRLGWFRCLTRMYEAERKDRPDTTPFSARYSLDDFAQVRPALCCGYQKESNYEENLVEWASMRDEPNVLIVFYEDIINDTPAVLDRLAHHVGVNPSLALRKKILLHVNFARMHTTYGALHEFSAEEADIKVGQAMPRFTYESNLDINQMWTAAVRLVEPSRWRDYSAFYEDLTGRTFPFEYATMPPEEEDYLCTDLQSAIAACLPKVDKDGKRRHLFPSNRFSRWK
ncbi:Cytosolic sulfotransferase 3 [Hondaea fermentalgiana]|uniref:Cytosolic sulfotransferase 3 n=1 Tax=Hondaea fermentalgiana TaxID=2315210 RepID=A0A2R5G4T0_9STRA|nr:Cytosolic sulfotransferase 3 [Hondaea fermentalgiana]|eukprot:GBG25565.1 Cytosolic sulfotransferase 3 [Hondaea fermentalgiana]